LNAIRILIVHPEQPGRRLLLEASREAGADVETVDRLDPDSLEEIPAPDLALYAYRSKRDLEILERLKTHYPCTQLTLLLPRECPEPDRLFFQSGARQFFFEPIDPATVQTLLGSAVRNIRQRRSKEAARGRERGDRARKILIGSAPAFRRALDLALKAARGTSTTVLLEGECGTGKGTFARLIHEEGTRASGPFIEVNCAAIPRNLMESEFFGHEAGAFTDARREKVGLFELADGGTIFLDEVAEIDISLQAKLLRVLDSKRLRRLSGSRDIPVDVRIIAATNQDLKRLIVEKRFRTDLYYRLAVVEIVLPPLRDRVEDIPRMTRHITNQFARKFKKKEIGVSDEVVDLFERYSWPGNVRELMNLLERAALLNQDHQITRNDLPPGFGEGPEREVTPNPSPPGIEVSFDHPEFSLPWMEKRIIEEALTATGGNVVAAARLLKVGRGNLRYRIQKYGIDVSEAAGRFSRT
jgi:two-component system response regulator AtoC